MLDLLASVRKLDKFSCLSSKVDIERVRACWREISGLTDTLILIKGLAVSRFYPVASMRNFADIDVCVRSINFHQVQRSLTKGLTIDLHDGLKGLDSLNWEDLFNFAQTILVGDQLVKVLRPEDHLRVICVHWLTDGGENKHRLWDIYYMVKNRPADFDWDRCLNVVSKRRRRWIVCTIGLAHRYLGLDLSGTPIEEEAKDLPKWLTKRVEKEWKRNIPLIPLSQAKHSRKTFFQQIWKRLPPNPIMATIDCEGDFDARTRIIYQIRDIVKRFRMRREREGKR